MGKERDSKNTRIALIGAGKIADIHAEAIHALPGRSVTAVVDTSESRAHALARRYGAKTYSSIDAMAGDQAADRAHVLTPPDTHAMLGQMLVDAGMPFLMEKPCASTAQTSAALVEAAGDLLAGVNQNSLYNAGFRPILEAVQDNRFGALQSASLFYAAPLRQLEAGQVGHWMFREPRNILLEQAVHPLAQVRALAGPLALDSSIPGDSTPIGDGRHFFDSFQLTLTGMVPVHLSFKVGAPYPVWRLVAHFEDGIITGDMLAGRAVSEGRSRYLEAMDMWISGRSAGKAMIKAAHEGLKDYAFSMLKLQDRSDVFYDSMKRSIAAFHDALDQDTQPLASLAFGDDLVALCEQAAPKPIAGAKPVFDAPKDPALGWVLVPGGTGFIGRAVIQALLKAGYGARVVARGMDNLPSVFQHPHVDLIQGDARNQALMDKAAKDCFATINLAHGGGGDSYEAVKAAMLGALEAPIEAASAAHHKAFIHIGSIAGLYLGGSGDVITSDTPPDPKAPLRADYARAKADCDTALLARMQAGFPGVILRPGIVVGPGTPAQHSGVGLFNNEQHCLGWSAGDTDLPFVLVGDVADACVKALSRPAVIGHAYNLVGDVRMGARDYIETLAARAKRPFVFHPQSPLAITLIENSKVLIKKLAGKKQAFHSLREFKSRAMYAAFDTDREKQDLDWHPVTDRDAFTRAAIDIFAPKGRQ